MLNRDVDGHVGEVGWDSTVDAFRVGTEVFDRRAVLLGDWFVGVEVEDFRKVLRSLEQRVDLDVGV